MSKLYFIPLGVGAVVAVVGLLYGIVSAHWVQTTNVLGGIGLVCMLGPLFGAGGSINNGGSISGDGFRSQKERMQDRLQGLRFGMFILFLGLPMLAASIAMYFVHPQ